MDSQKSIDIIRSILDHPQWEASYLYELIEEVMKSNTERKFSFTTNTAYLLNMYYQHTKEDSVVDGKAYAFIRKEHDKQDRNLIRVTYEVIKND